jgi:hypothetical protein
LVIKKKKKKKKKKKNEQPRYCFVSLGDFLDMKVDKVNFKILDSMLALMWYNFAKKGSISVLNF